MRFFVPSFFCPRGAEERSVPCASCERFTHEETKFRGVGESGILTCAAVKQPRPEHRERRRLNQVGNNYKFFLSMKRSYVKIAIVACSACLVMASCGGTKQVAQAPQQRLAQPQDDGADAEIARLEREAKLEEAKARLDAAKRQRQAEERRAAQLDALEESLEDGSQMILVPCQDEALDKIGEWMGGLGIGEHLTNQRVALENATQAASANLGQKFMGVVKNITKSYGSQTDTPNGKQASQADFERGLQIATKKVVDEYSNTICQKQMKIKLGSYKVYVASRIPIGTYKEKVAHELDVMKVKYDRNLLFKSMDDELDKEAEADEKKREQIARQMQHNRAQGVE